MNKLKTLLTTTIVALLVFSCSKSKDDAVAPASASVVGKWTFGAIGIKTDTKTVEATIADLTKLDADAGASLGKSSYEFKTDGTVITIDDTETETGKYVLDAGNKNITITSDKTIDPITGKLEISKFEIVTLTKTNLVLGAPVLTKKDAEGYFVTGNDDEDFANYLFGAIVFAAKGLDADDEFIKAKSMQIIVNLKK